jgi:hypothetical protein
MKYFLEQKTIEDLRTDFHRLCITMHPDKGGNHADFIEMKKEYDSLIERSVYLSNRSDINENKEPRHSAIHEKEISDMLEKIFSVPGITIELCGSWIWISGNTFAVKSQLFALGFRFSGTKKKWYFSPYMSTERKRGVYSMKKIYQKFGREVVESDAKAQLQIA